MNHCLIASVWLAAILRESRPMACVKCGKRGLRAPQRAATSQV
jgi:hypothetical protein